MPTSDTILAGLTNAANQWRLVAVAWHVALAAMLIALARGWRPSHRAAASLLSASVLSVGVVGWGSGNPVNGAVCASLAVMLFAAAGRLAKTPVRLAPAALLVPGSLLLALGWVYPHFLRADSLTPYFYAAPLGLLPCPTLSAVIGATLILEMHTARRWALPLAIAGFGYGAFGSFALRVPLDYGLLAGSAVLSGAWWLQASSRRESEARLRFGEASWFTGRKVMITRSALLIGAVALVAGVLATYRASQGVAILLVGASVAAFGVGLVLLHLWTTRGLRQ
jgi:hypothetical protein